MAIHSSTSLPVSATVCSVSASSAGEPVSAAATPLARAIVRFAASAKRMLPRLSSRSTAPHYRAPAWKTGAMTIGASLFCIAIGAILHWAVTATVSGVDLQTVGTILMIVGVLGLLITLF